MKAWCLEEELCSFFVFLKLVALIGNSNSHRIFTGYRLVILLVSIHFYYIASYEHSHLSLFSDVYICIYCLFLIIMHKTMLMLFHAHVTYNWYYDLCMYVCIYICLNGDEMCMLKPEINFCSVIVMSWKYIHSKWKRTNWKPKLLRKWVFIKQKIII